MRTADAALRNAEAVEAMDLMPGIVRRWEKDQSAMLENQASVARTGALLLDVTKFLRQMVQIAILALGAWLVVKHELSGGSMIAGSIILSRALQPVEQAISGWKQVSNARAANRRLKQFFNRPQRRPSGLPLPAPKGRLVVDNLVFTHPNSQKPILKGVSFDARPGEAVAVIGPSAAGKSTLARLLVGLHPPTSGTVAAGWRRDLHVAPGRYSEGIWATCPRMSNSSRAPLPRISRGFVSPIRPPSSRPRNLPTAMT